MGVGAKDLFGGAGIPGLELGHEFVFRCPAFFVFLRDPAREALGDFPGAFRSDVFADDGRHQVRMQSGEHLRDAAAGRIPPDDDISKLKLGGKTFDEVWRGRAQGNPARRYGRPAELGAYCAFLCSVPRMPSWCP